MSDLAGLKRALSESKAIVVCGAGVTRASTNNTAPGWFDLIKRGRDAAMKAAKANADVAWVKSLDELLQSSDVEDWLGAADVIQKKLGGPEGAPYKNFLTTAVGDLCVVNETVGEAICALGVPIATTNYDNCLCAQTGYAYATWREPTEVAATLLGRSLRVWHIHGHWKDPESVVFSARDYERVKGSELAQFLQSHAAFERSFVFVGCSADGLNDANVGGLLKWFGENFASVSSNHYAIVPETLVGAAWPAGVSAISCGADHGALAAFLRSLAPAVVVADNPHGLPPNPQMIGRSRHLSDVVDLLVADTQPVVIPGGPSMGKTTLALAAAHEPQIAKKFPRRFFVALDAATEPRAILTSVAQALGASASGNDVSVLGAISVCVENEPALVILDNSETPLTAGRDASIDYLKRLADVPGLTLVITIRGDTPALGRGAIVDDVPQLPLEDARALFLRESLIKVPADDPALTALLTELDGHPLSITLLAAHARGSKSLALLRNQWTKKRAALLADGPANHRLRNIRVSLALSLANCTDRAKRLFALLAYLPNGLAETDADTVMPSEGGLAALELRRLRLVVPDDTRLRVLAPLRETAHLDCPARAKDRDRLFDFVIDLAVQANTIGTEAWGASGQERLLSESGNFDEVVRAALEAGRSPARLTKALVAIQQLIEYSGIGTSQSIELAVRNARVVGDKMTEAVCARCMGDIAGARSDYDVARSWLKIARALFREGGAKVEVAHCVKRLGDIDLAQSNHEGARDAFEEAMILYRNAGNVSGEASCIESLGDIAFERDEYETAREAYEQALSLHRQLGEIVGEANCIKSLGDVAFQAGSLDRAREACEQAWRLYQLGGVVLGEANCIRSIGDIALKRGDVLQAREYFVRALPLYRRLGELQGEASCIARLGEKAFDVPDPVLGYDAYQQSLAIVQRIPEPYSIGLMCLALSRIAKDDAERTKFLEEARAAWTSIDREDLIDKHLPTEPLTH
jgi:tetratricopeptide (TPR) repeat protein